MLKFYFRICCIFNLIAVTFFNFIHFFVEKRITNINNLACFPCSHLCDFVKISDNMCKSTSECKIMLSKYEY